ncbi:hypothetical protein HYX11_00180 [Candidatus Woesearchaeota archaeon]|nr:hypothetical protein [Candidatus Woesearchaeota archaeon]
MVAKIEKIDSNRFLKIFREIFTNNFTNKQGRRGQVTVFIIMGIIILFSVAAIIYFTKVAAIQKIVEEKEPTIAVVPQEFQPIQIYTENCLKQIGKQGLQVLGEQGGYIYPELVGKFSGSKVTDTDGIDLQPLKVPYWHYNIKVNSEAEVLYSSLRPKLYFAEDEEMSVEAQLNRFINEKLNDCLKDYKAFDEQGFVVEERSGQEVKVSVGESGVGFLLSKEMAVTKGNSKQEMNQFYVKIPIKLKQMYETAVEITEVEQNYSFLERQALDLIAAYSGVNSNKLPPMEAATFEIMPKVYWVETDVKENLRGLLISHVPMLRYLGGDNFYRYDYPQNKNEVVTDLRDLYQKNYDNMILPLEKGKGLNVNFDYFGEDLYFDMNDNNGRIEPSNNGVSFGKLQFNSQHYFDTYDVSYPVLVTLSDAKAFDGEGFNFVFALESNIRNNQIPVSGYKQPALLGDIGKSMVCDYSKRNTQLVKTIVVDSSTLKPIEGVQIGFSIPNDDDCVIGETNDRGELNSKYPAVYGGVTSFMKEDYLTHFYPVDTYKFKEQRGIIGYALASGREERIVPLHKFKMINVTVKKKMLEKCIKNGDDEQCFAQGIFGNTGEVLYSYEPQVLEETHEWKYADAARNLGEKETATIILNKVADIIPGAVSDDFTATVMVNGAGESEIELVPGIYSVTGLLMDNEEIVISEEERCGGNVLYKLIGADCITFDETTLDTMLTGQVDWMEKGVYWMVTPEQLYGSQEITFYVVSYDERNVPEEEHKRVLEDLQVMGQLGNISKKVRSSLEPTFG